MFSMSTFFWEMFDAEPVFPAMRQACFASSCIGNNCINLSVAPNYCFTLVKNVNIVWAQKTNFARTIPSRSNVSAAAAKFLGGVKV